MSKQKIYTFRVIHPDFPTQTVTAEDADVAIFKAGGWAGTGPVSLMMPSPCGLVR